MNAFELYELQEVEELDREQFKITDTDSLSWALRKLRVIQQKKQEINDIANLEIERIEHFRKTETWKLEDSETFFQGLIEEYAQSQKESNPDFKVSTPYGSVKFRKQPAKWNYDDQKLLECLKYNGFDRFLRVKYEVNKADLKKAAEVVNGQVVDPETGVVFEGVTVEPQPEKIVVEVQK